MDDPVDNTPLAGSRRGLLVTALAPVVPQLLGSAFNIWYNATVIDPLLSPLGLKPRFVATVIVYNLAVYPVAVGAWLYAISSLRPHFRELSPRRRQFG